jgi:putative hemin transport protein
MGNLLRIIPMTLNELFKRPVIETELRQSYNHHISENPKSRQRDIACALVVSEAALIDEQCGVQSFRLRTEFASLIESLPKLGYIMTLMRNDCAVHERKGFYQNVHVNGAMGLVVGDDKKIDLRLFLSQWKHGYAVRENLGSGERYSLQFFNEAGIAIQKIFLQKESDLQKYKLLIENYKHEDQSSRVKFKNTKIIKKTANDDVVDQKKLFEDWKKMTNVHHFIGVLKRHNVDRQQAFRLVGRKYAEEFSTKKMELVLEQIVERKISLMCFVGNQGGIQIHTGVINKVKAMGPWLNILDREFNLHLLETSIATAWLVRKPTIDGIITSLELYDAEGRQVAQFFGERKEGQRENTHWQRLAEGVLQPCAIGHYDHPRIKNETHVA